MKTKHKIKLKIKSLLNKGGFSKGTSYTSTERKNNSRCVSRRSNYDQIDRNLSIILETNTGVTVLMNLTTDIDILCAVFLIQKINHDKEI